MATSTTSKMLSLWLGKPGDGGGELRDLLLPAGQGHRERDADTEGRHRPARRDQHYGGRRPTRFEHRRRGRDDRVRRRALRAHILGSESGPKLYHAGDTGIFGDMRLIGELYRPDLALLPIGNGVVMSPFEAAPAARLLGVRHVVPMHYGTSPFPVPRRSPGSTSPRLPPGERGDADGCCSDGTNA